MTDVDEILTHFARTAEGVWAVDAQQRIVLWNTAAEERLGYSADQALGQVCHELLSGRNPIGERICQDDCSVLACARSDELPEAFSMQVHNRDGGTTWIDVSVIVLPEGFGNQDGPVLVHLFRQVGKGRPWSPPLRIHLLGPILVERADGSCVGGRHWRRAKVRSLMALLVMHRGRPVHRSLLLSSIWPHMEAAQALANLNATVYHLRRSLEPDLIRGPDSRYIIYENPCYTLLGGESHWVDVQAFENGIQQARQQADPEEAIPRYEATLDLYRGDFLQDLGPDISWGWEERDRLRQRYLDSLEELAILCAKQGWERKAVRLLEKVLVIDPCQEAATQQLMRLALRRGDRAQALVHFRNLEEALWRELEVLPSAETVVLHESASRGP
jgi:PAS domain S-box-containing protein